MGTARPQAISRWRGRAAGPALASLARAKMSRCALLRMPPPRHSNVAGSVCIAGGDLSAGWAKRPCHPRRRASAFASCQASIRRSAIFTGLSLSLLLRADAAWLHLVVLRAGAFSVSRYNFTSSGICFLLHRALARHFLHLDLPSQSGDRPLGHHPRELGTIALAVRGILLGHAE